MADNSLIFVLDAQMPFIRHPDSPGCVEESRLFNAISYTYLPLLRSCTALETEGIPFKLAIAFSPSLCEMLSDPLLQARYLEYLDRAVDFGLAELERNGDQEEIRELIKVQLDLLQLNRRDFNDIYDRRILPKFDYFATRGYLEILATTATSCYLPLFSDIPEAVNAQIETGLVIYRKYFTSVPTGFWLPAMAWCPSLADTLKAYGFQYTFVDAHALLFADPAPRTGVFAPASCPNGLVVFARDTIASNEVAQAGSGMAFCPDYLDTERDIGFELSESALAPLFDVNLGRRVTGYRYHCRPSGAKTDPATYSISRAHRAVAADAAVFLERRTAALDKASTFPEGAPVTDVCAFPVESFGQTWFEGVQWLETLFRLAAREGTVSFSLPHARSGTVRVSEPVVPFTSSWAESGYAGDVLNSANDWMYPFIRKATLRMIDLAERFPDDTGLKERALDMAARELLLAQTMDWFVMMNETDRGEYGRRRFEESVRAFTVVYESLGSNFISTEWLTKIEKADNLFAEINYRVFSRKK
jgi:1,4-alpha-glucan branching enzyme